MSNQKDQFKLQDYFYSEIANSLPSKEGQMSYQREQDHQPRKEFLDTSNPAQLLSNTIKNNSQLKPDIQEQEQSNQGKPKVIESIDQNKKKKNYSQQGENRLDQQYQFLWEIQSQIETSNKYGNRNQKSSLKKSELTSKRQTSSNQNKNQQFQIKQYLSNNLQSIIPSSKKSLQQSYGFHIQQNDYELKQSEQNNSQKKDQYKNFIANMKRIHIKNFIIKYSKFQSHPLIENFFSKQATKIKDYRLIYKCEEFKQSFKQYFQSKQLYRDLLKSKVLLRTKLFYLAKLDVFQKLFHNPDTKDKFRN